MITIHPIQLPVPCMEQLRAEAREERFLFIERLWKEWQNGKNRFAAPGEKLYGCMDQATLVAIGGLTQDPFDGRRGIGRIRRVYVRSAWRNQGMGKPLFVLSSRMLEQASPPCTFVPIILRQLGFTNELVFHAVRI